MEKKGGLPPYELTTDRYEGLEQIRNFRQLLATLLQLADWEYLRQNATSEEEASMAAKEDKTEFAVIQPIEQMISIEPRGQGVSSFNDHADLLCIFGDGRNRWLDHAGKPCTPPERQRIARLIMSPRLCLLWQQALSPDGREKSTSGLELVHLLIAQGNSGAGARKFMVVDTFHEAASTMLHELANGYSVVFVALMFKDDFANRMVHGKAYSICKSIDELRSKERPVTVFREKETKKGKEIVEESKRYLGIIC